LLRAMDNLGASVGILISIALFNVLGYRPLFALAAVPSIIGAGLILKAIKEPKDPAGRVFKGFTFRDIDGNLALYIVLNGLFSLGSFTYSFLLLDARAAGFKTGFIPVLYLVFSASAALLAYPFGRLSDRIGRRAVMFMAYAAWAGVCVIVIATDRLPLVALLFVLFGVHKAALEPVQKTIAAELAPPAFRASVLGAFQMVVGLAALPASLLAGLLWDKAGRRVPFWVSLGLTAAAALLLLFVRERRGPRS